MSASFDHRVALPALQAYFYRAIAQINNQANTSDGFVTIFPPSVWLSLLLDLTLLTYPLPIS